MATELKPRAAALYDDDFYLWTRDQAAAIRARRFDGLDIDNLAEEVEDLGNEQKSAIRSRIRVAIEHLLKLQFSPAVEPRHGWRRTVRTQRQEISDRQTKSILTIVRDELPKLYSDARSNTVDALLAHGERAAADALPSECPYSFEQVTGDWFPPEPD